MCKLVICLGFALLATLPDDKELRGKPYLVFSADVRRLGPLRLLQETVMERSDLVALGTQAALAPHLA